MATTSTGYQTPATSREGLVPSVYDKVIQIGSAETPILTKIGTSTCKGIDHSWIIDPIGNPTRKPQTEISDFAGEGKSTKQKRTNAVEITTTDVMVSTDMQAIATYGGKELPYEVSKKAKEHKKNFEQMILGLGRDADVKTSVFKDPTLRTETTAGEAAGIFHFLAKGNSTFADGLRGNVKAFDSTKDWAGTATDMGWNEFNEILQIIYNGGADPKDVFVGTTLKAKINGFVSRQLGNEVKATETIKSIETDFGVVNIHLSRFFSEKFGLGDALLAGDFEFLKHSLLVSTKLEDVPTSKTAEAKRYYTSSTVEVRNADAFAIGVGLK